MEIGDNRIDKFHIFYMSTIQKKIQTIIAIET